MLSVNQKIGLRIKKARIEKGLNQSALAKLVNKSGTYISNLETGRSGFSVGTLERFSKALKKPFAYFYEWNEIEESENKATEEEHINNALKPLTLNQVIEKLMETLQRAGVTLPEGSFKFKEKYNTDTLYQLLLLLSTEQKKEIVKILMDDLLKVTK